MKISKILFFFAFLVAASMLKDPIALSFPAANTADKQIVLPDQNTLQNVVTKNNNIKNEIDYFAHLQPKHREILRRWLKTKPYLRPGVEEIDNSMFTAEYKDHFEDNIKMLREAVGAKGYQYYSVGDMNRDGETDFAVLLVDSRKDQDDDTDKFALAIFNAPFKIGQAPNYYEEDLYGITNSYIVFNKMIPKHLYLGKFESDVYCATYYAKGKTYYFKDCI